MTNKILCKKCKKCENQSYLTVGNFYLCPQCKTKDYEGIKILKKPIKKKTSRGNHPWKLEGNTTRATRNRYHAGLRPSKD